MGTTTIYGLGGFDPSKPNNNIIEEYEDDLPSGGPNQEAVAVIEAVRDPEQPTPSVEDRLTAIEALLAPLVQEVSSDEPQQPAP